MRKSCYIFILLLTPLFFLNCRCECEEGVVEDTICELENGTGSNVTISKNELVLKFNDKYINVLKDSIKESLGDNFSHETEEGIDVIEQKALNIAGERIKKKYGYPVAEEYCPCGDQRRQIWTFDQDMDIESIVDTMTEEDDSQVEGDLQFYMTLPAEGDGIPVVADNRGLVKEFLSSTNKGIVIAVLDTGLDLDFFDKIALYVNPPELSCGSSWSGWNFVSNTWDIQDDHENMGHGTAVTKTIARRLDGSVEYRILPLKVFDNRGEGSYWNIVCAMSFIEEINRNVEKEEDKIRLVNASFGGTLGSISEDKISILKHYIDRLSQEAILVASAGNCNFNTDSPDHKHYPSGYTSGNILSVGGYFQQDQQILLHEESNYGNLSIDISSPFDHIFMLDIDNDGTDEMLTFSGTSFSAADITSLTALLDQQGVLIGNNATLKKFNFLSSSFVISSDPLRPYISNGQFVK